MRFLDFSPTSSPSIDQQTDALQKGLGRAVLWAQAGKLDEEPLVQACVHDGRYDVQCEDSRGAWLWNIMSAAGMVERLRQPILDSLQHATAVRDAPQLCELVFHFAARGDSECKARLYEFVQLNSVADCPWIGEEQLLELDGEKAFRFIVRTRGDALKSRDWDWNDHAIVEDATKRLGKDRIAEILGGSTDAATERFAGAWRQAQTPRRGGGRQAYEMRTRAISDSDVLEAAYGPDHCHWFRAWGRHADRGDLETIIHVLRTSREPTLIAKLLKVFARRALPQFDSWLIELCRHPNEDVRNWALVALKMNSHPLVREFALSELQERRTDRSAVSLFCRNYMEGDEQRLLSLVELPEDAVLRHSMLFDLLDMLEENPQADCSQLAVIAYAQMPCEICRFRAVKLLVGNHIAPEWLIEECRNDSVEDCRSLIQKLVPETT